jgi:hypothetical protein
MKAAPYVVSREGTVIVEDVWWGEQTCGRKGAGAVILSLCNITFDESKYKHDEVKLASAARKGTYMYKLLERCEIMKTPSTILSE